MSIRFKIFIFSTTLISVTMSIVYIYVIGVVEEDRRNFINEYIENISAIENLRISSVVKNMKRISTALCLADTNNKDEIESLRDLINRIVTENKLVFFDFRKKNISVSYKKFEELSIEKIGDDVVYVSKYIILRFGTETCKVISAVDSEQITTLRSDSKDGRIYAIAISDHLLVQTNFKEVASKALTIVKSMSLKSRSGVFQNDEQVIGYARDEVEDITNLFMIRKEFFERAIISLRYNILLIGFAVLVVFLIIGFYISGRITRHMRLLQEKAHRIVQGVFEKIEISPSSDEIGDAVKAFNHMIEDLKAKEENLKESQMKLIQAEKLSAFGQLSAGIAHEVKNPLTSVMGYIQLARRVTKDERIGEYLSIAENETIRCKHILDGLLKFARMDRHQKSKVDICEVIDGTIKLISHQLMMKKIRLYSSSERSSMMIYGNANQLQQVLLNILINAMQSIERKGIQEGEISIKERIENGYVAISIKDNGEGISEENIGKIFEPFFTTKSDTGGTGLGLSISYGIIKEHNGNISVLSKVGECTEFIITLPVLNNN